MGGAGVAGSFTAGTPSLLRSINERSVLELLHRDGPLSRAHVARVSGLSKPTVSMTLAGLLDAGLVREVGRSRGVRGPSAILYELNPGAAFVVGIDVGRQWVRAAVADISGHVVARRDERARVRSVGNLINQIGAIAHSLAAEAGIAWEQVTHATLGSPGVFDPAKGHVVLAPNLPGWGRHGLVEALRDELGTNLSFENDVNLAALGEQARGRGRDVQNFVYLSVGTGIGAGLVLNGELYSGAHGAAGEIGYLPLGHADGREAGRRGTFEEAASAAGITRRARELGLPGAPTPKRVFAAARRSEPAALRLVDQEAARLALAIATVAPLLDPELVILGGGIGQNGDLLLRPIEKELRRISPFRPRLALSALGEEAVLTGAIATALAAARARVFTRPRRDARVAAG